MSDPEFSMVPGKISESYLPLPTYLASDEVLTDLIRAARDCDDNDIVAHAFIRSAVKELKDRGVIK